jgi:1-acyl-sn-glycerol-3-phosphate acyltransferase
MLYGFGSWLFLTGFRVLRLDVRSIGHGHIPRSGPAILASNHIGYVDFSFVALAPPAPRRPVRFLTRADVFEKRVAGFLLTRLGQIPIDVHGDPAAGLAAARAELERGEIVGIHPEGTISPSFVPRPARTGAVRLSQATGAPIIPVALWGSQRVLTKWRPARPTRGAAVLVRYGEPFLPPPGPPAVGSAELTARIRELLAKNQVDYPQVPGPPPDDWWVPAHLGGSAPTPEEAEERLRAQAEDRRRRRQAGSD